MNYLKPPTLPLDVKCKSKQKRNWIHNIKQARQTSPNSQTQKPHKIVKDKSYKQLYKNQQKQSNIYEVNTFKDYKDKKSDYHRSDLSIKTQQIDMQASTGSYSTKNFTKYPKTPTVMPDKFYQQSNLMTSSHQQYDRVVPPKTSKYNKFNIDNFQVDNIQANDDIKNGLDNKTRKRRSSVNQFKCQTPVNLKAQEKYKIITKTIETNQTQKDNKYKKPPKPPSDKTNKYPYSKQSNIQLTPTSQNIYLNKQNNTLFRSDNTHNKKKLECIKQILSNKKIVTYEIIRQLGKGSYGQVCLVRESLTRTLFAIKKMNKFKIIEEQNTRNIHRQLKVHAYLDHPNIIRLYSMFSDKQNIYIIMEYLPDGSLFDKLAQKTTFSEKKTSRIIKQIIEALMYMHKFKIIHRDLKLQNIMVSDKLIKLGDFGCAVHTLQLRSTKIGSLAYHSPEQLRQSLYDEKVDIWSLGIITYQLLFGETPYDRDIILILNSGNQNVQLSDLQFSPKINVDEQTKDFILRLLKKNPNKRMSLKQAIMHPFITKYNKQETIQFGLMN